MVLIPTVIDKTPQGERVYDIYSRLLEDRIIFVGDAVESTMVNTIVAQLLYLEKKDPDKEIIMHINTPGGEIYSGMAIYDTMNFIKSDVSTICVGMSASMAAFLLAAGKKGKRCILPNAEVMIHQPLGGAQGQATEIKIAAERILKLKKKLNKILAEVTGKDITTIDNDTERDYFMDSMEALNYGIVDKILK